VDRHVEVSVWAAAVVGSRDVGGVESLLLSRVSRGLIGPADRSVIVVPAAQAATARAGDAIAR
jgi:hypothetical protein